MTRPVSELFSDHKEADSRILHHVNHAAGQVYIVVVITADDTNVFATSLGLCDMISCPVYLNTLQLYRHI